MPSLYCRGKKYSATIQNYISILNDVENIANGVPTGAAVVTYVNESMASLAQFTYTVVTELPTTGADKTIYMVQDSSGKFYTMYFYVPASKKWITMGTTDNNISEPAVHIDDDGYFYAWT